MFFPRRFDDDDDIEACRYMHTQASSRIPRVHTAEGAEHVLTRDHRLVADRAGLSERDVLGLQRVAAAVRLHLRSTAEERKKGRRQPTDTFTTATTSRRVVKQEGVRNDGARLVDSVGSNADHAGDAGLVAALDLQSAIAAETGVAECGGGGGLCESSVRGFFDSLHIPSAAALSQQSNNLETLSALDSVVLQGGLPCGMLCEVAGESGAGKSTFCLYLAAVCSAAHGRAVTLLATSAAPPALGTLRRFCERVLASKAALTDAALRDALGRVTVVRDVCDWQSWGASKSRIEKHLKATACGLFIVDSLTAIAESNPPPTSGGAVGRRSDSVLALTGWLKTVADGCRLPVVLTNLAAAGGSATLASTASPAATGDSAGTAATAAGFASVLDDRANLGVALHHAVNIRTFIERLPPPFSALFHVTKTPVAAAASFAMRYTSATSDRTSDATSVSAEAAEHAAAVVPGAGVVRFDVLAAMEVRSARASLAAAAGHVLNSGVPRPLSDHTIHAAALMRPHQTSRS